MATVRNNADVYVDGDLKLKAAQVTHQFGTVVARKGPKVMRFNSAEKIDNTRTNALTFTATDAESGKVVQLTAISRGGCGCGRSKK